MASKLSRGTQLDGGKAGKEVELIEDTVWFNKIRGSESCFDLSKCAMPDGEQLLGGVRRLCKCYLNLEGAHCVGENKSGRYSQGAHWLARDDTSSWVFLFFCKCTWWRCD